MTCASCLAASRWWWRMVAVTATMLLTLAPCVLGGPIFDALDMGSDSLRASSWPAEGMLGATALEAEGESAGKKGGAENDGDEDDRDDESGETGKEGVASRDDSHAVSTEGGSETEGGYESYGAEVEDDTPKAQVDVNSRYERIQTERRQREEALRKLQEGALFGGGSGDEDGDGAGDDASQGVRGGEGSSKTGGCDVTQFEVVEDFMPTISPAEQGDISGNGGGIENGRGDTFSASDYSENGGDRADPHAYRLGESVTPRDVLNHVLRGMANIEFGSALSTPFHAVDGRLRGPVISLPGGDVGELLLGLHALETNQEAFELTDMQVAMLTADFIVRSEKNEFIVPVEAATLDNLCRRLNFCPPHHSLVNPPVELIPALRAELVRPDNQGSHYLANVLRYPETKNSAGSGGRHGFGVPNRLTESLIRALFNLVWGVPMNRMGRTALAIARGRIRLEVVTGKHEEQAVLRVDASACPGTAVPMLTPFSPPTSIALLYADVGRYARLMMGAWLADVVTKYALLSSGDAGSSKASDFDVDLLTDNEVAQEMVKKMDETALEHIAISRHLDGNRTAMFHITWPRSCCGSALGQVTPNDSGGDDNKNAADAPATVNKDEAKQ